MAKPKISALVCVLKGVAGSGWVHALWEQAAGGGQGGQNKHALSA